ncbi:indole-3-glycerol phosphate synthase TrpC [Polycyclovorans algicola]|uniref:indole-3-glycerol phosphate synthase TrpC n=1 Tax=Polycyclovorans algicola TaxID=616992 RepID=UPI0004A72973|nr:indole-3-glycerol phosphate synthase TrpC [Polycyclovorans algicola]
MTDILERIIEVKRDEIAALRRRTNARDLIELGNAATAVRGFIALLENGASQGPAVIAEIKKASPSKGVIRSDFDPATISKQYATGGAACLSVLTDQRFFQGHNDFLVAARAACTLPVIRKDFLVDTLQVLEARAIGADCVLLIAACLSAAQLNELHACARESLLDVLVEVHNAEELALVHQANLKDGWVLGVNNRNLRTFETRLETTLELLPDVPPGIAVVTESGIAERADVQRMMDADVRRFLIGESLMRQPDPGKALAGLIGAE